MIIRYAGRAPAFLLLLLLAACSGPVGDGEAEDEWGVDGPFAPGEPLGKSDSAGVAGPFVNTWTADTQVWTARNAWEDRDTPAAREAGIAWPANSGLNWDEKYALWIANMQRSAGHDTYFDTFTLTTPWGKTLPAPKLECAELAMFLRITFAAWYELPFYLEAVDAKGVRVYFGHFGARTKTSRYKNTPKFGHVYKDYSSWSMEKLAAEGWPRDAGLRVKSLYGGGDEMSFIEEGAHAGAYFDEIHLNKRVGHFLHLTLAYFGSMHLASSRNTFNLEPEALRTGDVLVERWQKSGIGHTLVVKTVEELDHGTLEAEIVSGSMPRRQPKWESGVASKSYFTDPRTGGEGENADGQAYVTLGGGLKRFRVTKNINGYWTNTWMAADEASWISDTDYDALKVRPAAFEQLLGEVTPTQKRDALLGVIEDARNHLREYPASCAARIKREDAFAKLYALMQDDFATDATGVDAAYRSFEDYVFQELEYTASKTCCWNSTTAAMFQIAMEYNQTLQADACFDPVVFKATGGGYQLFADYAAATGRAHLWKSWSEDESCPQRDVVDDVIVDSIEVPWCELGGDIGPVGCSDDGYEDNDSPGAATLVSGGNHQGLAICTGDDDFYRIEVPAGGSFTATISFDHAEGDLDLELTRDGSWVDTSQSVSNSETVGASGGGSYVVRVYGYDGAQAPYTLSFQ